jgi:hypothetical protein
VAFAALALYLANGDLLVGNDAKPSTFLAAKLLVRGELTFTPEAEPFLFHWGLRSAQGVRPETVEDWEQTIDGRSAAEQAAAGRLVLLQPKYYLAPSTQAGRYVSFYGPGPALAALPVYALRSALHGNLLEQPRRLWFTAKLAAALYVAASVALVFATARALAGRGPALLAAASYGVGTCVWSTSSQALWQHGPAAFFVALGMYFLQRTREQPGCAAGCGLSLSAAVACRPTIAILVLAVGLYFLLEQRRALWRYVVSGLPVAVLLGAYNWVHLGSAFRVAQSMQSAFTRTFSGSDDAWQTPFWTGFTGLLVSPSRGLLVYSPFLAAAAWGAWRSARDPRYGFLRPAALACGATIVVLSRFHGWWGGWSFGYRELVDLAPLLALLTVPVIPAILRSPWRTSLFALAVAWSVGVQVLGAFAYNVVDWNSLGGRNVDLAEHRARLWSVRDSQLVYYTVNFARARERKKELAEDWIAHPGR